MSYVQVVVISNMQNDEQTQVDFGLAYTYFSEEEAFMGRVKKEKEDIWQLLIGLLMTEELAGKNS